MWFSLLSQALGNCRQVQNINRPVAVDIRLRVVLTKVSAHQRQIQNVHTPIPVEIATRRNDNLMRVNTYIRNRLSVLIPEDNI